MGYEHIEIELRQLSRHPGMPCGDFFLRRKTEAHTTMILGDGKGHGIKANIAATMYATYLMQLLDEGYSLRQAFSKLVDIMQKTGRDKEPYAVFSVARILNDGVTTVMTYEMPPPVFISRRGAAVLGQRQLEFGNSIIYEANCYLKFGEGIMLMSDGVTQAGIGRGYAYGWGSESLCSFISQKIADKANFADIATAVQQKVFDICEFNNDDDVSIALAFSRKGTLSTIFTGPPTNRQDDSRYVRDFITSDGNKIICGGTTANIVAKVLGRQMTVGTSAASAFTPPSYNIDGIDLATEGAITLNQLYNIMDADRLLMDDSNPVTKLYDLVMASDKIIFYLGCVNFAAEIDIEFIQRGIKTRREIIPLIAARLRYLGKIVVIENI